jgi:hypothetical protein
MTKTVPANKTQCAKELVDDSLVNKAIKPGQSASAQPEPGLSEEQLRNFSDVLVKLAKHFSALANAPETNPRQHIEALVANSDESKNQ